MENTSTNTEIAIATSFSGVVEYATKQGSETLSAEAAVFKGGAALAALKDIALESALRKAVNGKYRAASDILAVAFPSTAKAFDKLYGVEPWANKKTMASFIEAVGNAKPGKSGNWNKKQESARTLLWALHSVPALAPARGEVVEAGEVVGA